MVTQPPPCMHSFIFFFLSFCVYDLRTSYVLDTGKSQRGLRMASKAAFGASSGSTTVYIITEGFPAFPLGKESCWTLCAKKPLHVDPTPLSKQGPHPVLFPLWQKWCWVTSTLYFGNSDSDNCHGRGCLIDGEMWWEEGSTVLLLICFLLMFRHPEFRFNFLTSQQLLSLSRRSQTKEMYLKSARSIC